jgi:hypothetical protein
MSSSHDSFYTQFIEHKGRARQNVPSITRLAAPCSTRPHPFITGDESFIHPARSHFKSWFVPQLKHAKFSFVSLPSYFVQATRDTSVKSHDSASRDQVAHRALSSTVRIHPKCDTPFRLAANAAPYCIARILYPPCLA